MENGITNLITSKIFQNIIDALPVHFFMTSRDHLLIGNNLRHARNFGYSSPTQLVGMDMRSIAENIKLDKTTIDIIYKNHNEVINTGKGKVIEYEFPSLIDGNIHTHMGHLEPLRDENDKTLGIVGILVDISDLKRTQAQLVKANQQAKAASQSKSEFIANMSHDIRTPITGMIGMVQELLNAANKTKESLKPQENESLTKQELIHKLNSVSALVPLIERDSHFLINATDELLRLCNEILETVSLETGRVSKKTESFDIRELIQRNIDLLQPVARNRQLTLFMEVAEDVPQYLTGLRTYLERIVLNLTSNALKFTEIGFVKLTLQLESPSVKPLMAGSSVVLQLSVTDSGIGIPEDKFDVVFENFSRLTPSFEGVYKGSGLGLYTVKQYLKAMQGTIAIQSELSKGSTFTISVPLEVAQHSDYKPSTIKIKNTPELAIPTKENKISFESDGRPQGRVLIVEDSYPAAVAISVLLTKQFNCNVELANNAETAINKAASGHYDLILMDIGLPDMDGITATKKIRAFPPPYGNVTVVALTGHMSKRDECLAAGIQDLLIKPAQPMMLENILQRYIFKQENIVSALPETVDNSTLLIDWKASVRMCSSDEAQARELLAMCITELKEASGQLDTLYQKKDIKRLRAVLHRCLGGVCYISLPRVERSLRNFQAEVNTEFLDEKAMEETYQKLRKTLSDFFSACEKNNFNH